MTIDLSGCSDQRIGGVNSRTAHGRQVARTHRRKKQGLALRGYLDLGSGRKIWLGMEMV
jgi:hypothetical protein